MNNSQMASAEGEWTCFAFPTIEHCVKGVVTNLHNMQLVRLSVFLALLLRIVGGRETATSSTFEDLVWSPVCTESYYDFTADLWFCQKGKNFGYRTHPNDPCDRDEAAPLIRMQAGKKYKLRFHNQASDETNIHTHGLHIPGEGNTDDTRRKAHPGGMLIYNWTIPIDHSDGTFWYHSHAFGEGKKQMEGGAVGFLLIDSDNPMNRPNWVTRERKLQIHDATLLLPDIRVNSKRGEVVELEKNKWHLLRVSLVGFSPLLLNRVKFSSRKCRVHTAAYDGVWRDVVPNPKTEYSHRLFHSNRVDFAIKCWGDSGVWYTSQDDFAIRLGLVKPLAKIKVVGNGADEGSVESWTPSRPAYLKDLRYAPISRDTFSVNVDTNSINGVGFKEGKEAPLGIFPFGSLQQWKLDDGILIDHPFHLHLYHMQIVTPGGCGGIFEEGQWYDTIAPPPSNCRVRFQLVDIGGRAVMHCHVPLHSEQGALGHVNVVGAPANVGPDEPDDFCDVSIPLSPVVEENPPLLTSKVSSKVPEVTPPPPSPPPSLASKVQEIAPPLPPPPPANKRSECLKKGYKAYQCAAHGYRKRNLKTVNPNFLAQNHKYCMDVHYDMFLVVEGVHFAGLAVPIGSVGQDCPSVVFHSTIVYHDKSIEKVAMIADQAEVATFDTDSMHHLGSRRFGSILKAFDNAPVGKEGAKFYDSITNNCASLLRNMADPLDVLVDDAVIDFVTKRLLVNGDVHLWDGIRSSPSLNLLLEGGKRMLKAANQEALIRKLIALYV